MFRLPKPVTIGLLIGILGVCLHPFVLDLEEDIGLRLLFKLRGEREVPSDVIIVAIDKASANDLNLPAEPWKWPRSLHGRLTENLVKEGAAVIAFDIIFKEERSEDQDNILANAIRTAGNVVLCKCLYRKPIQDSEKALAGDSINKEVEVPPISCLARSALAVAPFPLPKIPVKLSQYWTIWTNSRGDRLDPTLPVVVFQIFALEIYDDFRRLLGNIDPPQLNQLPRDKDSITADKGVAKLILDLRAIFEKKPSIAQKILEELKVPAAFPVDAKKNQILTSLVKIYRGGPSRYLNFYGPPGTIETVSYSQLLNRQNNAGGNRKRHDFKNKAVFVGLSEPRLPEKKEHFHYVFSQHGIDISGVEVAATAFANLLEEMPVQPLGLGARFLTILFWGMTVGLICMLFPILIAAGSVTGLSALYLTASHYQFKHTGVWFPLVIPLFIQGPVAFFGAVLWRYFHTTREREYIRKAFGFFLPDGVVDEIAKDMGNIKTGGEILYGTCLNTDAEQFTRLAEIMNPGELASFMNRYYEAIFEPVKRNGGIISNIVGDSMLAIWARAQPDADARNRACSAALEIASAVHRFNQSSGAHKLPTRVGLHSGQVFVGNIGAVGRFERRPVGDIVNTATRIEGLNKHLGTQILVSKEVVHQLNGFLARENGKFLLRGKSKPIEVYELICRTEESSGEQRNLCDIFTKALDAFRRQSWEEAIKIFHEAIKIYGDDGPSTFYLTLCKKYKHNPPQETWEGLVLLDDK
jgi:adenylate cyclase